MPSFQFEFSRISFWLGFLAATLLWWVIGRVRPMLPEIRAAFRRFFQAVSQRNFASVENHLRRETLRVAQRMHLAAPLFALDEILVPPALLAPPAAPAEGGGYIEGAFGGTTVAEHIVPYLPDWPEWSAAFNVPRITAAAAVQSGRSLALIAPPGGGKTVALAHLAAQVCRRDPALGPWSASVPVLGHAADLNLPEQGPAAGLEPLVQLASAAAGPVMGTQTPRFLRAALRQGRRLLLLLDGMDELAPQQFAPIARWLAALTRDFPQVQVVTTASPGFLDGLTAAGFYPLAVSGWGPAQREELARRWGRMWTEVLLPEVKKQAPAADADPVLMNHWLAGETAPVSPLEWTLRVWGAYAGDLSGSAPTAAIRAHLARFLPDTALYPALEALAGQMLRDETPLIAFDVAEKVLSAFKPAKNLPAAVEPPPAVAEGHPAGAAKPQKKGARGGSFSTQGERITEALTQGGVLVEHSGGRLRFASPALLGFLACGPLADSGAQGQPHCAPADLLWTAREQACHYAAARSEEGGWILPLVDDPQPPLYLTLLTAARWLRDAPPAAAWKGATMRALIALAQDESAPPGVRARAVAAFAGSRDPAAPRLFKQLLETKSAALRRLALLGSGALGSPQMMKDLLPALGDRSAQARAAAVIAIGALSGEHARGALIEVMLNGDEDLRQAAAEALAHCAGDGHKALEEAAAEQDLLTRRAAVFGLAQVREAWSRKLLEKIAIEDGQWVVRNAAAEALDAFQKPTSAVPPALTPPSETPWLLAFAGKLGMGILPGAPAQDVLMAVLKSGSPEEQAAALRYLRDCPDEAVVRAVSELLNSGDEQTAAPALYALWWMAASGVKLPPA